MITSKKIIFLILISFFPFFTSSISLFAAEEIAPEKIIYKAQRVMDALTLTHDADLFDKILSQNAKITLEINGKIFQYNKENYIKKLKQAFSENIIDTRLIHMQITPTSSEHVTITDEFVQKTMGHGFAEKGDGYYHVTDKAIYHFIKENGEIKIDQMEHHYIKNKL